MPAYVGTTETLGLLLQAEELFLTLEGEATRLALIQRAMTPCYLKLLPNEMVKGIISYLLGIFTIKWSPLWKQATSSLETLTRLYPAEVWSCLHTCLLHISGYADENGVLYTHEEVEAFRQSHSSEEMELEEKEKEERSEVAEVREEEFQLKQRPSARIRLCIRFGSLRTPRSHVYSPLEEILFE